MITREEYNRALKVIKDYKMQLDNHYTEVMCDFSSLSKFYDVNKEMRVCDADVSVRTLSLISAMGIQKISDFSKTSINEILKFKNVGKKTIDEIKELCFYAGVDLK